ncbi:hypothetical protein BLNAU_4533 [Blattamonas nauphoetae]|uniref:Uncharacterized protein n=1 Tax=Blattamonas nauphoetae TaxID=2049346 RepID=A0ABQ9Y974_9EUKA|nr:hypothetical protein BLNAU_4533 [Blattamonas nauphoetae]
MTTRGFQITIRLILHNSNFSSLDLAPLRSLPLHSVTINYATQHLTLNHGEYCALVGTLMREATASVGAHRAKRRGEEEGHVTAKHQSIWIRVGQDEAGAKVKRRTEAADVSACVLFDLMQREADSNTSSDSDSESNHKQAGEGHSGMERVVLLNSPRSACNIQAADTPLEEGYAVPINSLWSPPRILWIR